MASACVNNIGMSPENFLDCAPGTYPSYGWLSPRISFSRKLPEDDPSKPKLPENSMEKSDPDSPIIGDFEFRLEDPVNVLPADELFSDGKLVPLHLSMNRQTVTSTKNSSPLISPEPAKFRRRNEISGTDPNLFSPKAPRCSSRWKELLGLKKLYINSSNSTRQDNMKTTSPSSCTSRDHNSSTKSLKNFLHRSSKSSLESSLSLPLLKDADNEFSSVSSRMSLSSSSSGHEHDDVARLSLDSDKPNLNHNPISNTRNANTVSNLPRVRVGNPRVGRSLIRRRQTEANTTRGVSVDSPRMNSSGKIVFHSLERSSSSPSSFNGGPRFKHRGMERSYSANVRITRVLNVPVCSLRGSSSKSGVFGFTLFSSPQKRESSGGGGSKGQLSNFKNRFDRS